MSFSRQLEVLLELWCSFVLIHLHDLGPRQKSETVGDVTAIGALAEHVELGPILRCDNYTHTIYIHKHIHYMHTCPHTLFKQHFKNNCVSSSLFKHNQQYSFFVAGAGGGDAALADPPHDEA